MDGEYNEDDHPDHKLGIQVRTIGGRGMLTIEDEGLLPREHAEALRASLMTALERLNATLAAADAADAEDFEAFG